MLKKLLPAAATLAVTVLLGTSLSAHFKGVPLRSLNIILSNSNFEGLFILEETELPFKEEQLHRWDLYFQKVTRAMPQQPEGPGMLGFCYFHRDALQEAIAQWQKASRLAPEFSAYHYNLGVAYMRKQDYGEALNAFRRSMAIPFESNLKFLPSSKIYMDLFRKSNHQRLDAVRHLQETYFLSSIGAAKAALALGQNALAGQFLGQAMTFQPGTLPEKLREYFQPTQPLRPRLF